MNCQGRICNCMACEYPPTYEDRQIALKCREFCKYVETVGLEEVRTRALTLELETDESLAARYRAELRRYPFLIRLLHMKRIGVRRSPGRL